MSGISEVLVLSFKNLQCSSHPNLRISWFWWNLELNHRRENPSISAPCAYGICSDLTWTIHTTRSHHHQLIGIGAIEIGTANWWPLKENTDQSSMNQWSELYNKRFAACWNFWDVGVTKELSQQYAVVRIMSVNLELHMNFINFIRPQKLSLTQ